MMRGDINQSNIDCKLIIGHRSDSAWHVTNIITLCSDLVNHLPCDSLNKRSESGSRVPRVTERVECCRAPRWPCRPRFSLRAVFLPSLPWDAIAAGRIYKSSNKTFPSSSLRISSKEREAWSLLARSAASPLRRRSGKKRIFRLILSVGAPWRARCRGARGRRFEPAM